MSFRHGFWQGQALNGWNTSEFFFRKGLKLCNLISAGVVLGVISSSVYAQSDAAAIKIGESDFVPTVRFEYLQTDNSFSTNTDQTEATAFVIRPSANWTADRRLLSLTGIYQGAYASYSESVLNYADHSLRGIVNAELSSRQRVRARLNFDFGHQALGTGLTRGVTDSDSQVEFFNTAFQGSYLYGARQARGNVEVGFGVTNRTYQNQDTLTDGYDYTSVRPYGRFSLRLSSDTRAIVTARFNRTDYDQKTNQISRDRDDMSLLAGLSFDATGKTGGEFQVGATRTSFSRALATDQTSVEAEADLFYEPTKFSRFTLTAERVLDNNVGSSFDLNTALFITDTANLKWEHEWSSRFYHVANVSYRVENGDCPASENDNLTRATGGIELNLVIRRWLHVGTSFRGVSRETSPCANDEPNAGTTDRDLSYESRTFGAHMRATL